MAGKVLFEGGVSGVLWTDRRDFYPEPYTVNELWADPWMEFVTQLETKNVSDPIFKLFENESSFYKREFTVSTATTVADSDTESAAITVGNIVGMNSSVDSSWVGWACEVWDATKKTKRGLIFISTANSSTTIKCKTMKSAAVTTVSGDYFIPKFRIRGEKSVALEGKQQELSVIFNSTGYISNSCEISGTAYQANKLRGYSDEMTYQRQEMFKTYNQAKLDMLLTSVSTVGISGTLTEANLRTITDSDGNSGVVRSTYGYFPILEDFGTVYNGTGTMNEFTNLFKLPYASLDYAKFIEAHEIISNTRNVDEAFGFSGRGALTKIATRIADGSSKFGWLGKATLTPNQTNEVFGFKVRGLESPHGILWLVSTRGLRGTYTDSIAIPNPDHTKLAIFRGDEYASNVKRDNDYDGYKDTIKSEQGLCLTQLKSQSAIQFV